MLSTCHVSQLLLSPASLHSSRCQAQPEAWLFLSLIPKLVTHGHRQNQYVLDTAQDIHVQVAQATEA